LGWGAPVQGTMVPVMASMIILVSL
jgi:hypothetical protein